MGGKLVPLALGLLCYPDISLFLGFCFIPPSLVYCLETSCERMRRQCSSGPSCLNLC